MVRGCESRVGCSAVESTMNAAAIVVFLEFVELSLKNTSDPERYQIEELTSDAADQSFDKRMRFAAADCRRPLSAGPVSVGGHA